MNKIRFTFLAAALTSALCTGVHAQRHAVEPEVLHAQPAPPPQQVDVAGMFAESYRNAGSPRIAVYWNRQLSDTLGSNYQQFDRHTSTSHDSSTENVDSTKTSFGHATLEEKDHSHRTVDEQVSGTRLTNADPARPQTDESIGWRLESSFYDPLLAAGVRLIDRTVIMRTLNGGASQGSAPDIQSVEARALLGKADYLLEVLMTSDADSPIGSRFRVTVKEVGTGEIVGFLSTRALPQSSTRTRYVATSNGFKRQTTAAIPNLEDFAHRLAEETMFQLTRSWEVSGARLRKK